MATPAYVFYDNAGVAHTIPVGDVAQLIEASPSEKARGVSQKLQQLSTGIWLEVRAHNAMLLSAQTGVVSHKHN